MSAKDKNGNEDMSRVNPWAPLIPAQKQQMEVIKLAANALHQLYVDGKKEARNGEEARLWAVALTQLELASMAAVKAVTSDRGVPA